MYAGANAPDLKNGRKIMKKILAVCLCLLLTASVFAGCGGKTEEKGLFKMDLSEYMTVEDYKGIKISSDDETFLSLVKEQIEYDLANGGYGEKVEVASGKVQMGDTATITYVGTLDGVPFEGGTETEGYDLVIGSGSFIEGFEDGLIGASIGSTVKLNLKFPDPYQNNPDLAGKDVVFTVNVKTVTRTDYPDVNDEIAKKLGHDSAEEYNAYAFSLAVKGYCYEKIIESAKMTKTPKKEVDYFVDMEMDYYRDMAAQYGVSFETVMGADEKTVEKQVREQVEKGISTYAVLYYIAQKEDLIPTADDVEAEYKEVASMYSTTSSQMSVSEVKDIVDYNQVEYSIVYEDVLQLLFENADIAE